MSVLECEVCGRELGFIIGVEYDEDAYCKECWQQMSKRHDWWIKTHPAEAFARAQQVLDEVFGNPTNGLVVKDIL